MKISFHSLKVEQTEGKRYAIPDEARADVFEHIESYYHQKRRHSPLICLSSREYEARMAAK